MYCVYLTSYLGNKLPPFYIGSSSADKILNQSYRGSVSSLQYKNIFKQELFDNPHLFKTQIISYHISRSDAYEKEIYLQKKLNVVASSLYFNMSCSRGLPNRKGTKLSEKAKNKMSLSRKGKPLSERGKLAAKNRKRGEHHFKGKKLSLEHRNKISESLKGRPPHNKNKPKTEEEKLKISQGSKFKKNYLILSPDNNILVINNLNLFCKQNNLEWSSLYRTLVGKHVKQHKGYILLKRL